MALSTGNVTLLDWAKRLDPDGKIAVVGELLNQANGVLDDMVFIEGNGPTGHTSSVRTGLPSVFWRLLNQGVQPSKSTTAQITESIGMLEAWSEVDKDLAELNGNLGAFRMSESQPFVEAMAQEMAQTLFYGRTDTAPEEFHGLSIRYSSLSATNGQNILNAAGAGSDNSSIWLVGWGDNTVHGIFPKGSKVGLQHEDLGLVTVETSAGLPGTRMRAYQERFQWKCGLVLKDWRYAVRICNIDVSNLAGKSSAADLFDLMIKAIHRIPQMASCKPAFYMNRTCFEMLDIQRRDDVVSGGGLTFDNADGKGPQYGFRGIPVRICDQLTEAETLVS